MNWKGLLYVALSGLLSTGVAFAQEVKELNIDDEVPENMELGQLINSSVKGYKFSDFKGKLLILDFWGTFCGGCIEAMPKMEALQKQFGDKIMILPVTHESKEKAGTAWKENHILKNIKLPSVVGARPLLKLFGVGSIPFEVWVKDGKVIGLTDPEHVNEREISLVLNGEKRNFPIARKVDYDYSKPFLQTRNDLQWSNNSIYYTAIFPYLKQGSRNAGLLKENKEKGYYEFSAVNYTVRGLYTIFLRIRNDMTPNRIFTRAEDSAYFSPVGRKEYRSEWDEKNVFCVEGRFPLSLTRVEIANRMLDELNFYLNMDGRIVSRQTNCFVIKELNQTSRSVSTMGHYTTSNAPNFQGVEDLLLMLNAKENGPVILNGITQTEKLGIPMSLTDIYDTKLLKKELAVYGLDLVPSKQQVDFFILQRKNRE